MTQQIQGQSRSSQHLLAIFVLLFFNFLFFFLFVIRNLALDSKQQTKQSNPQTAHQWHENMPHLYHTAQWRKCEITAWWVRAATFFFCSVLMNNDMMKGPRGKEVGWRSASFCSLAHWALQKDIPLCREAVAEAAPPGIREWTVEYKSTVMHRQKVAQIVLDLWFTLFWKLC